MSHPSTKTFALSLSLVACLAFFPALLRSHFTAGPGGSTFNSAMRANNEAGLKEAYGKLPLAFEANQGRTDATVKYLARGSGYSLFLTPNEAVLSLSTASRAPSGKEGLRRNYQRP